MFNFDPNILNPNMFWDAWKNTQNVSQTMLNFFDMLWKNQKFQSSPNILGEFVQKCMSYASFNAYIANKLFMSLSKINNVEDLSNLQESIFIEYSEQSLSHIKQILNSYHELLKEGYKNTKQQTENFVHKCSETSSEMVDQINSHISNFTETAQSSSSKHNNCKSQNNYHKKNNSNKE